jgi:PKD domain
MRRALAPLVLTVAILAGAPAASAKEWCVPPATGCTDNAGDLQTALDLARMNAGPDSIRLGATTYTPTSGGFTYSDSGSSTNSVAITGADSTATTLTHSSLGAILTITSSGGALNSLTDMGFHITQSSSAGLQGGRADATRVAVAGDPAITNSVGLTVASGAMRSVNVSMPLGGANQGVFVSGGTSGDGVFDSTISADNAVSVPLSAVQRCDVTGGHFGVLTQSGRIDDVMVHVSGTGPDRAGLNATNNSIADGSAVARHLTILGATDAGSIGIRVYGDSSFTGHTESLEVRNTIVRGVEHSYQRAASASPAGTANLTMHYSDYDPATRDDSGLGAGPSPSDPTNLNTDPLFVDPAHGDFRLAFNSPLVDAGDPATLAADEPNTDLAGRPRVVNGRRDIGAFEYQRQPPVITSATANPGAAQVGTPFSFSGTATDPDADPVSLAWSFDDGGSVPGAGVKHAFAKPGIHVATIKATDAAGVTSTKTVLVAATAGPVPVLSALALVPKKFRPAKGTDVRFKLSAGAPVRFTVERRGAGRKVGGKCRATTKKNRHAKKCTRYVSMKGSFVRNGVSGANHFHWKGRLKGKALKPGGYRLTGAVGSGLTKRLRRSGFTIKR